MKKLFTIPIFLTLTTAFSQTLMKQANLDSEGNLYVQDIYVPENLFNSNFNVDIEPFLSFGTPAFQYSKNTRGLTLADLDGDGIDELLIGINTKFFAIKGDGSLLIEKTIPGPMLYPPAVADLDGDGNLEIVLNYGFSTLQNGINVLDHQGNELPGWPKTFGTTLVNNAPTVADLDDDGNYEIITAQRASATSALIHVYNLDGTYFNENWPYDILSVSCFTPSVGDIDNDGTKEIIVAGYNTGLFALKPDATVLPGFPVVAAGVAYSYQSPMLVDLDGDGDLEIVGANHGDNSGFYVREHDGSYRAGWPVAATGWTYAPPSVADVNGDGTYEIFVGHPNFTDGVELPTIYGFKPNADNFEDFPINKIGGNEGVITIADINDDGVMELIFGSNITDSEGYGFLHAYSVDGSGEIDGFPLRPRGFTFLNGAVIGDINDDGMMDLSLNSHTMNFGADIDSAFVTSYHLNVPFGESKILVNGYKGGNTREGLVIEEATASTVESGKNKLSIYPNPSNGILNIQIEKPVKNMHITVLTMAGKKVFEQTNKDSKSQYNYQLGHLPPGVYLIYMKLDDEYFSNKWIKK